METAIYLNEEVNIYIEMLDGVNVYVDELHEEINTIYETQQLIKDLRSSK